MLKKKIIAGLLPLMLAAAGSAQAGFYGSSYYSPGYEQEGSCAAASTNDGDYYPNNHWNIPALLNGQSVQVESIATWDNGTPAQGYYATFYCNDGTISTPDVYYYWNYAYWYPGW
jgi:hypothetical protein